MPQAQGSRHDLSYVAESVFGTTPGTPTMLGLRYNSTTLNLAKAQLVSEEVRSDRMITDARHGNHAPAGDIVAELSYGTFDDLIAAALAGAWTANVLDGGVTPKFFSIERRFEDITQFAVFKGAMINSMALSIRPNQIVGVTFGIMARDMAISGSSLGSPTADPTDQVFDSFTGSLTEGGSGIAIVTGLDINLDNGLEPTYVVGSKLASQINLGRRNVTGRLSAYFQDATLLNKFVNETVSSLVVTLTDPGGKDYIITLPRIKYMGADIPVPGPGGIIMDMPFQALRDTSTGKDITITRSPT